MVSIAPPELSPEILCPSPCLSSYFTLPTKPYILTTVKEPDIKEIDGSCVQFYPIIVQTNHEGFTSHSVVDKRFSEFQQFRRFLIDKGLSPPPLRWTRKIPTFNGISRREEMQDFVDYVTQEDPLSRCPKEIQSFLQTQQDTNFTFKRRSSLLSVLSRSPSRSMTSPF